MPQTLGHSNIHLVFSTKNREPYICAEIETDLYSYICGICKQLKSQVHAINGMADHVHILIEQHRSIALADLVSKIKANSSKWAKQHNYGHRSFAWQGGYGYFAVGKPQFEAAMEYVLRQKEHHRPGLTFQDEMRAVYRARGIDFDESYVWD